MTAQILSCTRLGEQPSQVKTVMECWIIVENVPDIGVRALTSLFKEHNPKQVFVSSNNKNACIEFSTKENARAALQGINDLHL